MLWYEMVWQRSLPCMEKPFARTNYGVWQKDYNNTITGESFENLIYPEFKGYHANLYWATLESKTTPFTVYAHNDGIYFRVFTPEEPKGRADGKPTMPEFPQGDISPCGNSGIVGLPSARPFGSSGVNTRK